MSRFTSFRAIGSTSRIVGKAMRKELNQACIHLARKSSTQPRLRKVITMDMINDMINEVKKASSFAAW
jgi:hypothetical protein